MGEPTHSLECLRPLGPGQSTGGQWLAWTLGCLHASCVVMAGSRGWVLSQKAPQSKHCWTSGLNPHVPAGRCGGCSMHTPSSMHTLSSRLVAPPNHSHQSPCPFLSLTSWPRLRVHRTQCVLVPGRAPPRGPRGLGWRREAPSVPSASPGLSVLGLGLHPGHGPGGRQGGGEIGRASCRERV